LEAQADVSIADVRQNLGVKISSHESCPTAIYVALRFRNQPFSEMQDFVAACGGDVDTIGAMAGAIWGAANGTTNMPKEALLRLERRDQLIALATALYQFVTKSDTTG
jgi:ADP-ribosylglycohydrolase